MSLSKIHTGSGDFYLIYQSDESNGSHEIRLTDCHKIWTGEVSSDDLQLMSESLGMSHDEYVQDTLNALTHNTSRTNFEYSAKQKSNDSIVLSWKKCIPGEDIRVQLGSVTLSRDESSQLNSVFDMVIASSQKVNATISSLRSENERLSSERLIALKRLDKLVAAKEDLETDLYSKFALVINEKKKKLRDLRDEVESLTSESSTKHKTHSKKKVPSEILEDSNDETNSERNANGASDNSDYETYDAMDVKPSTSKGSCAKRRVAPMNDAADFAFEGDEEISPVVATKSRRRGKREIKKTPSKPVIPKIPSSESKKSLLSTKRRTSLRKTNSRKSTTSDPDIDDLLNTGFE